MCDGGLWDLRQKQGNPVAAVEPEAFKGVGKAIGRPVQRKMAPVPAGTVLENLTDREALRVSCSPFIADGCGHVVGCGPRPAECLSQRVVVASRLQHFRASGASILSSGSVGRSLLQRNRAEIHPLKAAMKSLTGLLTYAGKCGWNKILFCHYSL